MFWKPGRNPRGYPEPPAHCGPGDGVSNSAGPNTSGPQAGPDSPTVANVIAHPGPDHPVTNGHAGNRPNTNASDCGHSHRRAAYLDARADRHAHRDTCVYSHTDAIPNADSDTDSRSNLGDPDPGSDSDSHAQDQPAAGKPRRGPTAALGPCRDRSDQPG